MLAGEGVEMIKEAINHLKLGAVSGLANCHLPGIYSLVLQPRKDSKDGMLRVFYTSAEAKLNILEDDNDFMVMPHNHRQDITLYRLFGKATNMRLSFAGGPMKDRHGEPWRGVHEYAFGSALLGGKFTLNYRREDFAIFICQELSERPFYLKWSDVHTIVAEPNSAWVVKEGDLAPEPYVSLSYSRQMNKQLKSEGLYRKMGPNELLTLSRALASWGLAGECSNNSVASQSVVG
jgi:hypothetical protein